MKTKVSPTMVGAFVIGAFTLGVIALLSFGGVSLFYKPQRFVVYFDESIHGLDLGSPVKLRGVRVGRVVDLNVRYDAKTNHSAAVVVCEFAKDAVNDVKGAGIDVASRDGMQTLVDHGLRARLDVLGLATGLLFVELEFFDPKEYPATNAYATDAKYVVVPAVPSAISELQGHLTEILGKFTKIDFEGLATEVKTLMVSTRKQIDSVDLHGTVEQWKRTGATVEELAKSPEIKQALANLNGAITDIRGLLAKVDSQVGANGAQLQATLAQAKDTLESFNAAATGVRKFIAAQSGLGEEATHTLQQLGDAAEAVQRLADFLERNPQALISGKKRPQ